MDSAPDKLKAQVPLLRVQNLVKHFPLRRRAFGKDPSVVHAVDDISFEIDAGTTMALVGESGCGKSTVGRLVLRLLEATAGRVWFDGVDITTLNPAKLRAQRRHMQMIFQDPYASLNPRMTIEQTLTEPLLLHGLALGRQRARVLELLDLVGLPAQYLRRYPHEFSGGQRQRIGIARALAVEPKLIVCDEAVSALDVSVQAQVVNLLQDLQRMLGISYIFIAHDLAVVKHIATHVAVMYLGQMVEYAPASVLFAAPRHPYTQALLAAIPIPDPTIAVRRVALQGDVPNPIDPPSGCRFRTRCNYAQARCDAQVPALLESEPGHRIACHFWREIGQQADPATMQQTPAEAPRSAARIRLDRLQAAFATSRHI